MIYYFIPFKRLFATARLAKRCRATSTRRNHVKLGYSNKLLKSFGAVFQSCQRCYVISTHIGEQCCDKPILHLLPACRCAMHQQSISSRDVHAAVAELMGITQVGEETSSRNLPRQRTAKFWLLQNDANVEFCIGLLVPLIGRISRLNMQ